MIRVSTHIVPVALCLVVLNGCGQKGSVIREYDEVVISPPRTEAAAVAHAGASSLAPAAMGSAKPITWQVPPGWKEEPGSGMRLATFRVEVDGDAAECSMISLSGDAGGLVPNVKRWIGQLGIDVPPSEALNSFLSDQGAFTTAGGHDGLLIDLAALMEEQPASAVSMLVGSISRGSQTVFVKFTGTKAVLEAERARFEALCASLD